MGWTYSHHWPTVKDVHKHVLSPSYFGEGWKIIDHAATNIGRHLWVIVETPDGKKVLGLWLIKKHDGECGYKDMDESMGPAYYDCPLRLLDLVPEPDYGYAKEWREKVRAYHAAKVKDWKPGDECLINGTRYTVIARYNRSWLIEDKNGRRWRGQPSKMRRP